MQYEIAFTIDVVIKLAISVLLGGIVGMEREAHDRPAGLRTHVLVCVGSAVYMMISMSFSTNADPGRIAAQVATGMGFLGVGTIIRHGNAVRGLTTAASLWAVAAVGLAVGRGEVGYIIAIATTVFVILTLKGLSWVEDRMINKKQYRYLTLQVHQVRKNLPELQSLLEKLGAEIRSYEIRGLTQEEVQELVLSLRLSPKSKIQTINSEISSLEFVDSAGWE